MIAKNKSIYYSIDLTKIFCAILIVFMHTYSQDLGNTGTWIVDVICNIGVPFFFIASGFFYTKGLMRNEKEERKYFSKYFTRVSWMYLAWSIITLPIAYIIIQRAHGDYPTFLKFIYLLRLFFFTGSIGIYWYVLALIYNSAIIYYAHKKKFIPLLFVISTIFWIIGTIYNSPYNNGSLFFESIHIIFGSERNFLHVGLFYMCIGYLMAKYENLLKMNVHYLMIAFMGSIFLRSLEVQYLHTNMLQALEAILLFLVAININQETFKLQKYSLQIRQLSTAIYLEHFPFILLFDFYLREGTAIDFTMAILFCIVFYFFMKRILPTKWFGVLYGG